VLRNINLELERLLEGKTVLITGGTGPIGLQLARRFVANCSPKRIRLLHLRSDLSLNSDDQTFLDRNSDRIEHEAGTIDNDNVLESLEDVQIAVHLAALTRVAECEQQPIRAVEINLEASLALIRQLDDVHCERGVFVSSVRATSPVNVYAMTKNLMERLVSKQPESKTMFSAVRLGMVVWPIPGLVFERWQNLVEQKKPLDVYDARKYRYLLSMSATIDSIIYALVAANHGDIIVPNMKATQMESLARILTEHYPPRRDKYKIKSPSGRVSDPTDRILAKSELPFTRERSPSPGTVFYHVNRQKPSLENVSVLDAKNNLLSDEELRKLLADAGLYRFAG
jgi:UDP-N-acetylglucosamine 4,6-dehydratase/5-epimerase